MENAYEDDEDIFTIPIHEWPNEPVAVDWGALEILSRIYNYVAENHDETECAVCFEFFEEMERMRVLRPPDMHCSMATARNDMSNMPQKPIINN